MTVTDRTAVEPTSVAEFVYGGLRLLSGLALFVGGLLWTGLWGAVIRLHVLAGDFGAAGLATLVLLVPALVVGFWQRGL